MSPHKNLNRALIILACLFLTLPTLRASARQSDDYPPLAYVYNAQTDELVAITADGPTTPYHLGIAEIFPASTSVSISANDLAFDETGARVAYCAVDYTRNVQAAYPAHLVVRDIQSATNIVDLDLGTVTACRVPQKSFNASSNTVFAALTIAPYGDPASIPPSWRLVRVDVATSAIVNEINNTTPELTNSDFVDVPVAVDIQYLEPNGATLVFSLYPYGAGSGFEAEAYIWQIAANKLSQTTEWGQTSMDISFEAGERIYLAVDPSLPYGDSTAGDIPSYNAVRIVDDTGSARTIFHRPEGGFFDLAFINEGQQLAVQFIPNQPDASIVWIIVARDGTTNEINADHVYSDIQNAPGGYINFWIDQTQSDNTVASSFAVAYVTPDATSTLWSAESADSSAYWQLAWVRPVLGQSGLAHFVNFAG